MNIDFSNQKKEKKSFWKGVALGGLGVFLFVMHSGMISSQNENSRALFSIHGKLVELYEEAAKLKAHIPDRMFEPTSEWPFVFFHQRKAGGTTVRQELMKEARSHDPHTRTFIACLSPDKYNVTGKGRLSCTTYHSPMGEITKANAPAMYGGHLFFNPFHKTMFVVENPGAQIHPPEANKFTCLTVFREPLSRIQSCFNFRFIQTANPDNADIYAHFSDVPANLMVDHLSHLKSAHGEGCLNEPMRIFSDYGENEDIVNHLHEVDEAIAHHAALQTVQRVADHCVIGTLERCEDTKKIVDHYLPFLSEAFSCKKRLNTGQVEKHDLSDEQVAEIRKVSVYEDVVYYAANRLMDQQLEAIDDE